MQILVLKTVRLFLSFISELMHEAACVDETDKV